MYLSELSQASMYSCGRCLCPTRVAACDGLADTLQLCKRRPAFWQQQACQGMSGGIDSCHYSLAGYRGNDMYFVELLEIQPIFPFTLLMVCIRRWPSYSRRLWKTTGIGVVWGFTSSFSLHCVVVISSGTVPEQSCH